MTGSNNSVVADVFGDRRTGRSTFISKAKPVLARALLTVVAVCFLYIVFGLYVAGEPIFAVVSFSLGIAIVVLFGWARFYTWRFVFPGVAAVAIFIVLPVLYTSGIGFTNYSASNILSFERVQQYHLGQMVKQPNSERPFSLTKDLRLYFPPYEERPGLITDPMTSANQSRLTARAAQDAPADLLGVKETIKNRSTLQDLIVEVPGGGELTMAGLRTFASSSAFYTLTDDDVLLGADGTKLQPNHEVGFYENAEGELLTPGWPVGVGFENFKKVLFADGVRQPMVEIFIWTCVFAFLSMVFTSAVGTFLAMILQWEHLAFKSVYKVLLILPYAVPAFISILVFRGLFNQNFGEINLILSSLFGIAPDWFTNPMLSRAMLLLVNTWLGFPYWMLLAAGFLQAVPRDHFKAAALENSGPIRNFFCDHFATDFPTDGAAIDREFCIQF